MYDGNQVLRFENKYKASDLGGLGIELIQRKGTGNYDKDRTCFNYSYVPLIKSTLQEQVYSKLKDNKIYYVVRMNEINKVCYYTHTDINMNNITKEIAEL